MTAMPNVSPRIIYVASLNCDRYVRSAKSMSTDRVLKYDYRPIPCSQSIRASLIVTVGGTIYFACILCTVDESSDTNCHITHLAGL